MTDRHEAYLMLTRDNVCMHFTGHEWGRVKTERDNKEIWITYQCRDCKLYRWRCYTRATQRHSAWEYDDTEVDYPAFRFNEEDDVGQYDRKL